MKGIIMNEDSVLAILDGRKTQTRRLIKGVGPYIPEGKYRYDGMLEGVHAIELLDENGNPTEHYIDCESPLYFPGEIVYVKEAFFKAHGEYFYEANPMIKRFLVTSSDFTSPRYMPQDAARLFLRILNIRVERLCDISVDDAISEGIEPVPGAHASVVILNAYYNRFFQLNKHIDPDSNPLVWVYEFEVI